MFLSKTNLSNQMNVLLSYINTQLFIFALKLVRYQPNRTIQGKFTGSIQIEALVDVVSSSAYITNSFYLKSSKPVTMAITSICKIVHEEYREDYDGNEELIFSEVIIAKLTIAAGRTESNKEEYTSGGIGNRTQYYLSSKDHSSWNMKTFNGFTYKLSRDNWH